MLRFSDGVNIDTSGPLRIIHLQGGYYVVVEGTLIHVKSAEEGRRMINRLRNTAN